MDSLVRQVSRLWGYSRGGDSIRVNIIDAARRAERDHKVRIAGRPAFVYPVANCPGTIRITESGDQRDPDEIPLEEYHLALWLAVSVSGGSVEVQDAQRIGAGLLGFQRLTANLTDRFREAINQSTQIESSPYSNVDRPLILDGDRLVMK